MSSNKIPSKSSNNSSMFYVMAAAGVAGVVGGLYYLWTTFVEPEELNEQEIIEIEELKQEVELNKGEITKDTAVHILCMTNHHAEEEIKKMKPEIDKKRRDAINDEEEYRRICGEYLEAKEICYMNSSQRIMTEFGTNMEVIQKLLENVSPVELEKKFFEFNAPKFEKEKPSKDKTKEAFIFFGNKFIEEMQGLSNQARSMQFAMSQEAQQAMMFNLLVCKMKVEDMIYIKYNLTEHQIRFMLNEHGLMNDWEIQQMHSKIASFEEMMG